ncbi:MAG: DUF6285 domain-containing protein [Acidimicrobiales bacterium]
MQDAPDASHLLGAVADLLEESVVPRIEPALQHQVRVAANLCRIVQREVALGAAADAEGRRRLAILLGHDGSSEALWRELAARLGADDDTAVCVEDEASVHAALLAIVRDKLAVAKPGYDSYDFAEEHP